MSSPVVGIREGGLIVRQRVMVRSVRGVLGYAAAAGFAALLFLAAPAPAQELQRIAAVVNDEAISFYDLAVRIDFVIATSGLDNTVAVRREIAPQVLQGLVNEKLQLQAAERLAIEVSEEDLQRAIGSIERQNNMPPGSFDDYLTSRGLHRHTAIDQIRARIAWAKLVRQRLGPTVVVGPEEVDAAIERITADRGKPHYYVQEIFLGVEGPEEEHGVRADAENLVAQLRNGAAFPAIARQFSQSATAAVGGDLGWVLAGQLPPEIAAELVNMKPGTISEPIRTLEGYQILHLVDRRVPAAEQSPGAEVELAQILLPVPGNAIPEEAEVTHNVAQQIEGTVAGCNDMIELAAEMGAPGSGNLGTVRLRDLPDEIRAAIAHLPVGQASAPVRTENGWHVLMVCGREEPERGEIDRERVREELNNRRLDLLGRRYLRDLHRQAFIDIRI